MTADEPRSIPSRLAPVLEALELDQPRVVTADTLARRAEDHGIDTDGQQLAYDLRRLGWLIGLRTKGAWEFVPGARAGRFGAGDRHIELRAALAVDVGFRGALAMESAAVALGLAGRVPDREVLWVPPGRRVPKSFGDWRVVRLAVSDDAIAPVSVGQYMHARLPNSTLHVMQATGHCPHMSNPDEVLAVMGAYLAQHGL